MSGCRLAMPLFLLILASCGSKYEQAAQRIGSALVASPSQTTASLIPQQPATEREAERTPSREITDGCRITLSAEGQLYLSDCDLNNDGNVDGLDHEAACEHASPFFADLNNDGYIDEMDYELLERFCTVPEDEQVSDEAESQETLAYSGALEPDLM